MNARAFSLIYDAIGAYGISGLDRLYSFMIVRNLQQFVTRYHAMVGDRRNSEVFAAAARVLEPVVSLPPNAVRFYADVVGKAQRFFPVITGAIESGHVRLVLMQTG